MVFINPGLGFRLIRFRPVLQCIDAGLVIFTERQKLGILCYKDIDLVSIVLESLTNMMCRVIQCEIGRLGGDDAICC